MTRRQYIAVSIGQYALWYACVEGAARGIPWVGPVLVLLWSVGAVVVANDRIAMAGRILGCTGLGYLADSAVVLTGALSFPEQAQLGGPSTVWMVAIWTLMGSLLHLFPVIKTLRAHAIAAAVGALGAPLAYYAGVELDAAFVDGWGGYGIIALSWLVATPFLMLLGNWRRPTEEPDAPQLTLRKRAVRPR